MLCSNCGTDNEAGLKFCGECGTRLAVPCPSCSTANPPGRRFCGECGTFLETTSSALTDPERPPADASSSVAPAASQTESVAERKLVSVLFADLVDFTAASEARDPEEVRETLTRYFDLAREVIGRYGGSIEKFIGDAVMAVWGTPVAHEDDAERAVRAALELVDAVGALAASDGGALEGTAEAQLHLRAAVVTGEAAVTVGAIGQGMVAGDLVNTASRLQSVAPPDTVLVGEATYRATNEAITFEPVGEQQLKGKTLPLPAWRAVQVFAMLRGTGRGHGLEAPFVGRDPEFRLLKELFHATVRERRLHLISVTGIAGIGKSRLAWEFLKYVDGLVEDLYWHQGRSPAYGEGVTFWALGEMVRRRAGIAETDDDVTTRQKLTATLADFVPDEAERRHIEPRLEALLGLAVGPSGEREELFTAWRSFFEHVARRGPTVLVFEELHWADAGVLDFIESLLDWSRNLPILILTLARPELLDRRPTWGAGQRNFVALHLEPLDDEAMRQLLDGLAPGLPDALVRRVLQRAAGVPLYAVETVRMLVDGGLLVGDEGRYIVAGDVSRLAVPETLHALIAARLDSLEPVERALLQDAAVLGQTFTVASLSALTTRPAAELEDRLRGLVRKEILIFDADPRSPERGQYGFVQGLIRDVAHDTLSRRDRRAKHLAAARYYEGLGTDELAAVLAGHYLSAHEATPPGPEADALSAQARVALRAAAERAASLQSHEQALAFLEAAETVTRDSTERAVLWERMADVARAAGRFDVAEARFEAAIAWHDDRHDAAAAARLTARLGDVLLRTGHVQTATTRLQGVLTAGLPEGEAARLGAMLGRAYMLQEEDEQALEWIERALPAAGRAGEVEVVAEALTTKGPVVGQLGRSAEAVALLYGALALAESHGLYATRFRATYNLAGRLYADDPAAAFRVLKDGLDLARRLGQRGWFVTVAGFAVGAAMDAGEWDWATAVADEIFEFELPAEPRLELEIWLSNILAYRGETEAAQRMVEGHEGVLADLGATQAQTYWVGRAELAMIAGKLEDAVAAAERAMEATSGDAWWAASTNSRAAFRLGDLDRLRVSLAAIEAAPEHGRFFDVLADTSRADILALEGKRVEASRLFADVIRRYHELGVPNSAAETSLDFVLAMGIDDPAARVAAEEARAFWLRLGAGAALERLDEAITRGPIAPPSRPPARSAEGVPTRR